MRKYVSTSKPSSDGRFMGGKELLPPTYQRFGRRPGVLALAPSHGESVRSKGPGVQQSWLLNRSRCRSEPFNFHIFWLAGFVLKSRT